MPKKRYPPKEKQHIISAVLDGMTNHGLSLRQSCIKAQVPKITFLQWKEADPELINQYARARAALMDHWADEVLEIANERPSKTDKGNVDTGYVQDKRVRMDSRKWILSKLSPKKYGDRVQVDSNSDSESELAKQMAALVEKLSG